MKNIAWLNVSVEVWRLIDVDVRSPSQKLKRLANPKLRRDRGISELAMVRSGIFMIVNHNEVWVK